ncbi:hypothetical protein L226DRAFT_395162 [Lentinus tigrinus ALCF2SS1-7]|uniref:uncharacterized protein n=1 Tax=Lentinus tigrinus ALCF2SS1-7 TaxID=1328758 RepID=UPI001165ED98|nr:hypothetical protein L226DRAFT_395162 [Lentinus tigrinus ALCF2SS1-7]
MNLWRSRASVSLPLSRVGRPRFVHLRLPRLSSRDHSSGRCGHQSAGAWQRGEVGASLLPLPFFAQTNQLFLIGSDAGIRGWKRHGPPQRPSRAPSMTHRIAPRGAVPHQHESTTLLPRVIPATDITLNHKASS